MLLKAPAQQNPGATKVENKKWAWGVFSYGESRRTGRVLAWSCNGGSGSYRVSQKLMNLLEDISDKMRLGYVIHRRVLRYYTGEEDGLDMRKALSRDIEKKSSPLNGQLLPDELRV